MRIVSFLSLYFYIIDSFLVPFRPHNIFKNIITIHNKRISFLQRNAIFLLNVTRRVNQRRYQLVSLLLEDNYNLTNYVEPEFGFLDLHKIQNNTYYGGQKNEVDLIPIVYEAKLDYNSTNLEELFNQAWNSTKQQSIDDEKSCGCNL